MDKYLKYLGINKKIFIFLLGIMIVGIIFGSSLPLFLNNEDRVLVGEYLSNFISQINNYNSIDLLKNGLVSNGLFLVLIWILGISIIGIPIVIFLFFSKCFIFGFSISSIIANYGAKGILFSFTYIFPNQVINICIYGILTNISLIFSFKILFLLLKKNNYNINYSFNRYFKVFLVCFMVFILSLLYESFISPIVLSFVINFLGI